MIIKSSQISMDASSGHTDVTKTVGGQGSGRPLQSMEAEADIRDFLFADTLLSTHLKNSGTASSTVDQESLAKAEFSTEYAMSRTVETMSGIGARIRSLRSGTFPGGWDDSVAGHRRYHRIDRQQFSLDFRSTRVSLETENLDFHSSGQVVTADGRSIEFSLELSLHRSTLVRESYLGRLAAGQLVDPLVLHFDEGVDALAEHSFFFDLDCDGKQESISGLNKGSGFLAFDKDGDGSITNGGELFGPLGGSGFGDLAGYDHDENGWIDEGDPIFSQLLVWMGAAGGAQELLSLQEAGVGAISLSHAGSAFNLRSQSDILLGRVSASGIFLKENGEVRSLQDVQLSTRDAGGETAEGFGERIEILRALDSLRSIIADQRNRLHRLLHQHPVFDRMEMSYADRGPGGVEPGADRTTLMEQLLFGDLADTQNKSG